MHGGVGSAGDVLDLVGTVAPIAVSNAYKAQQMLQNGYAVDSKGRRVVDTDTGDAFSKALGFNPAVVAESGRAREEVFNRAAMLRDMKARISERWADGIAHREPEKAAEAREMLARWNENNPETPIRIDLAAVLRRARLARMRDGRIEASIPVADVARRDVGFQKMLDGILGDWRLSLVAGEDKQ